MEDRGGSGCSKILAKQKLLRYYPGLNLVFNSRLEALQASSRVEHMRAVAVLVDPQHGSCRLFFSFPHFRSRYFAGQSSSTPGNESGQALGCFDLPLSLHQLSVDFDIVYFKFFFLSVLPIGNGIQVYWSENQPQLRKYRHAITSSE